MKNKQQMNKGNYKDLMIKGFLQNLLTSLPILLGFLIMLTATGKLTPLRLSLASLVAGFSGIIVIIRRESPAAIMTIQGKAAILMGILFTTLCWGMALFFWFEM